MADAPDFSGRMTNIPATEYPGRIRGSSADAADPSTPDHLIDQRLVWMLRFLGREFGPLGVALAAARMTDRDALIQRLYRPADYQPQPRNEDGSVGPEPTSRCSNPRCLRPEYAHSGPCDTGPAKRLVSHVTGKSTDVGFDKPGQLRLAEEAAREVGYRMLRGGPQPYLKLNVETRTLDLWDPKTDSWNRDLRGEPSDTDPDA